MRPPQKNTIICVIGLGYVGLPLAEAFAHHFKVIGFDANGDKVNFLKYKNSLNSNLILSNNPGDLGKADYIFICVPTPVTPNKEPDLSYVMRAAEVIGRNMKKGAIVILESTVFPGVTEDIVKPILEKESGLKCGADFKIGYSPERVNPGDSDHSVDKTAKIVSSTEPQTAEELSQLYLKIVPNVFIAKDIRTAEAAKLVENIQRDINIAIVNELAMIFDKMGLSIQDVLDAASTKWNFHRYSPGMVGGHCIPVVPYFLAHKALELGYQPQLILAGRAVNDFMPRHIAQITIKTLKSAGKAINGSRVLIMGLTYKENVPDTRESQVRGIIEELSKSGVEIYGHDPLLEGIKAEFGINEVKDIKAAKRVDAIIVTVAHSRFKELSLTDLKIVMNEKPVLIDVKQVFDRDEAEMEGFYYQTL